MKNKRTGKGAVISVVIVMAWVAIGLMTGTRRVSAATFTVMNLNDSGMGSLRQAILDANMMAGADTINFQAGLTGTITLMSALPQITQDLTITGPGAGVLTVSGASAFQVFNIASAVTVSISDLTIANGHISTLGGGISNAGTLTVSNSTFSSNSAQFGGGIYSEGTLTVTNNTFSGNSATASGAGGGINNQGTLTITNSTFSGNSASVNGGGILNGNSLAVTNCTFTGNTASGLGGGIHHFRELLAVTNSTFSGNSAASGGGISNGAGFNEGALIVTNSTFTGNSASVNGGGILNGAISTLLVTNSTFSSNSAASGGGLFNGDLLKVSNSTFSGNSASGSGGGIFNNAGSSTTVKNSIIANSPSGGNCAGPVAITPVGVNFSTDMTCAGFTVVPSTGVGGLNLGPLQDNGGPTFTHALLPGSVAIDAVMDCTDLSAMPAPVTTDQRGKPRPADGDGNGSALCDAGAFELQPCTMVTCPANITQSNDNNQCGAVVTYSAPTTTGDCSTVTCTPASGSFFPVGMTTVNCDASGTTANPDCSFTVTVNDTQPPTITCPANITVATDPNLCSAVVSYTTPTPIDNCKAMVACSPASGSTFQKGTTTVTCTAIDASGNTSSCSFTVTVNDTQAPSITCPANITVPTDPNQCSAVVNYSAPTVNDNCPGVGVPVCSPASGSTFQKGTTTVTCTVADATGNTGSCSFTVTVVDMQPPMISCPANVTAVAAQTCPLSTTTAVTFPDPTFSDNCPGATVACVPPSGSIFPAGTTTVTCTATDTSGNTASCSFTVSVFSACLQDDSVPTNVVLFNLTGEYRFCCNGTIFSGTGIASVRGCVVSIQHNPVDRRVLLTFDGALHRGTASLQSPPGTTKCTIIDRDTTNNTCACQGHR